MTYIIPLLILSNLLLAVAVMYLNWRINKITKLNEWAIKELGFVNDAIHTLMMLIKSKEEQQP